MTIISREDDEEFARLRTEVEYLRKELESSRLRNAELERLRSGAVSAESNELPVSIDEFEETLRRVVQRTAMIVQAEMCVIMALDNENQELQARSPAWGMNDETVKRFHVSSTSGYSGEVFRTGNPAILEDSHANPYARMEKLEEFGIHNAVSVPLSVEKRDDEGRVVDRLPIGVLHCFNKRFSETFSEEDVRLLDRLARSAAAIISNAQMYQEVVAEKQKLAHTLESLTVGLLLINQQGRIGQMNAQARELFNLNSEMNPIGKPYDQVIQHKQSLEIINKNLTDSNRQPQEISLDGSASIGSDKPQIDEITIFDVEDDESIYQVHTAGVRDASDNAIGTVFIFNDITEIRNVEKMKTEFVAIVAHELRTPLTPIKGFVSTLLEGLEENWFTKAEQHEFLTTIEDNVDRLARMINDLLNVSRIERLGAAGIEMNWEMADLRLSADAVMDTQKARSDKHTIVVDFEPEHIIAETDPDKIQNILHNFVSNAIKYSDGGVVRIIARQKEPDADFPEGSVVMGVKDQGVGLSEDELKKIGEKFFRSKNKKAKSAGGTGIGLFLVKHLIAGLGGYMWVESELGHGSVFWFRFPLHQPKQVTQGDGS